MKAEWEKYKLEYSTFLLIEKSLASNSIAGYMKDIEKLAQYFEVEDPKNISSIQVQEFLGWVYQSGLSPNSQARILSGIKGFYKYLLEQNHVKLSPVDLIEAPKLPRKLPEFLSTEEVDQLVCGIDHSLPDGTRNRLIIEMLYGCGLRVSELIDLKISNLNFEKKYIKVFGKGNKERLVPMNEVAAKWLKLYLTSYREHILAESKNSDSLFINHKQEKLNRGTIFLMIKKLSDNVGIKKNISPHTFRHTFATHLVEGGADLRAVQDLLGHESITTTEIYTHLDQRYLRTTINSCHPRSKAVTI